MSSQYLTARDGLPARVSGLWAEEKLEYLQKYMAIFTGGMKNRFPNLVFLDLLAGSGKCVDQAGGYEFDGSPLLALKCPVPFTRVVLVENHIKLVAALRARVGDRASVIEGDCNDQAVIEALRDAVLPDALGLAFVDNLGLTVTFDTLRQLTKGKRIDLFINFQISDLKRNRGAASVGDDDPRWTAFFGTETWRGVVDRALSENVSAEDTATRLLDLYEQQLGTIDYASVGHGRRVMKNSKNVGLYRVLLAGKHPLAVEFFDKVSKIEPRGQRGLLD